jgi:hypothetical protein
MLVTTTDTIQNQIIEEYLGIVTAEVVYGTNVLRDFLAGIRDAIGGRTGSYERLDYSYGNGSKVPVIRTILEFIVILWFSLIINYHCPQLFPFSIYQSIY